MLRTEILNRLALARGYQRYLEIGVQDRAQNFDHVVCEWKDGVDPCFNGTIQHGDRTRMMGVTSDDFFQAARGGSTLPIRGQVRAEYASGGALVLKRHDKDSVLCVPAAWRVPYDLIFIDGDHREPQVFRDVMNALDFLTPDGTIVMHDVNPPTAHHAAEENHGGEWNGTVWRAFVRIRAARPDLLMFTVDTDWGVGIVQRRGAMRWDLPMHALHPLDEVLLSNRRLPFERLEAHRDMGFAGKRLAPARQQLLGLVTPKNFLDAIERMGGAG